MKNSTNELIIMLEDIKKNGINSQSTRIGFELICGELRRRGIQIHEREYFDWNKA